ISAGSYARTAPALSRPRLSPRMGRSSGFPSALSRWRGVRRRNDEDRVGAATTDVGGAMAHYMLLVYQEEVDPADQVSLAVARAFCDERAIVLATLIRQAGDFQLAEDAVQDAFEAAVTAWRRAGIPANPGAWITTAAPPRAIDRLRRNRSVADRAERLAELARLDH